MTKMDELLHDHIELEHALSTLRSQLRAINDIDVVGDLSILQQGELAVQAEAMSDALIRHVDDEESQIFPLMRKRLREDLTQLDDLQKEHVILRAQANSVVDGLRSSHYPFSSILDDVEVLYRALDVHSTEEATLFSTRMGDLYPDKYMGG